MSSPLLVRRWADLDVTARAAFLARGLDDIFDPALQASIADPAGGGSTRTGTPARSAIRTPRTSARLVTTTATEAASFPAAI